MTLITLLSHWRAEPAIHENIVTWQIVPPRPARYEPIPPDVHPALAGARRSRNITQLSSHQVSAWKHAQIGNHFAAEIAIGHSGVQVTGVVGVLGFPATHLFLPPSLTTQLQRRPKIQLEVVVLSGNEFSSKK